MGGRFFQLPFSHSWFLRPSGTDLLALMISRACLNLVPRNNDLKKLLAGGPSINFWYGVKEDGYLGASALGSVVLDTKQFRRTDWRASRRFVGSTYLALIGA